MLKGRSNYLCRQRIVELSRAGPNSTSTDWPSGRRPDELGARRVGAATGTGDRADLGHEPAPDSLGGGQRRRSLECPGAPQCPQGDDCFAEDARQGRRRRRRDRGEHPPLRGPPGHRGAACCPSTIWWIVDEAHQLEDVMSDTCGLELGPGRLVALGRSAAGELA